MDLHSMRRHPVLNRMCYILGFNFLFYFALCMCVYSRKQKIIKMLYLVPKNLTFARFGGGD